ncbi:MAG TPA: sulfatase-like hydrolase/transferase [Bacilli bacterium]|nr:sulfatase-like hydrolase/transferase [Bacilli bacterium]
MRLLKKHSKITVISFFLVINLINAMLITLINKTNNWETSSGMLFNSLLGNLGFIVVLLSIALFFCRYKKRLAIFLIIETFFLSFLMVGITVFYGYYKMFPSFYNLKAFSGESSGDALQFLIEALAELLRNIKWLYGLPVVLIIALYALIYRKDKVISKEEVFSSRKYKASIVFLIGALFIGGSQKFYDQLVSETWNEENVTATYGLQAKGVLNFYLGEAVEYFITKEKEPSEIEITNYLQELSKYQQDSQISFVDGNIMKNNELYNSMFAGKNLLLIQLESESNFLIGLKVKVGDEYVEVTPNLNSLVPKSIYCNNYYTTVGIGNTSDAEFTAMTGLNPSGSRYTVYEYNRQPYEALPKLFKDKGYFTFATHANDGFFYSRTDNFVDMYGFDLFLDKEYYLNNIPNYEANLIHGWVGDAQFLEQTVKEMKDQSEITGKPVFSFPITVSNHIPYFLDGSGTFYGQKELLFPNGVTGIPEKYTNYLEHSAYNDYAIGQALLALKEQGIADDTVVVMFGDHGCGINIFEMFYETPELFINEINPIIVYDDDKTCRNLREQQFLLTVPFFIYDASEAENVPSQTISLVRGHESIKRTIANLFGLDAEYFFGVDILSDSKAACYNPRNLTVITDGMVISGSSQKRFYYNEYSYSNNEAFQIVAGALKYKEVNDKILQYNLFALK